MGLLRLIVPINYALIQLISMGSASNFDTVNRWNAPGYKHLETNCWKHVCSAEEGCGCLSIQGRGIADNNAGIAGFPLGFLWRGKKSMPGALTGAQIFVSLAIRRWSRRHIFRNVPVLNGPGIAGLFSIGRLFRAQGPCATERPPRCRGDSFRYFRNLNYARFSALPTMKLGDFRDHQVLKISFRSERHRFHRKNGLETVSISCGSAHSRSLAPARIFFFPGRSD